MDTNDAWHQAMLQYSQQQAGDIERIGGASLLFVDFASVVVILLLAMIITLGVLLSARSL